MRGSIGIDVDDRDVRAGIAKLRLAGKSLRPVFLKLKKPFKQDLKDNQKSQSGPSGPWAPRAASTKERDRKAKTQGKGKRQRKFKRRRKNKLLGKLPTSVTTKQNPDSFVGESKIPWASAHQDGARVGRGSILPAREFLFFSDPFLDQADREIMNHLESGWRK